METTATVALVLSVLSLMCCGALLILCLALLRPSDSRYTDLAKRVDEQDKLLDLYGVANKELFRYLEILNDAVVGPGHHMFLPARVPSSTPGGLDDGTH